MAVTAVAAIVGAGAVTAGVAGTTMAMIGLGVTAVGMVTKSKTLMKIGAGLGMGSMGASLLGLGESAAAQASNAAWAESGAAKMGEMSAPGVTESAAAAVDAVPEAATLGDWVPGQSAQGAPAAAAPPTQPVPEAMRPTLPETPTPQPAASQPAAQTGSTARASTPVAQTSAPSQPGIVREAAAGQDWATKVGEMSKPDVQAGSAWTPRTHEPGKTFFSKVGTWFSDLSPAGKLAVGQSVAGLVSGVGKGAADYMAAQEEREFQKGIIAERYRRRDAVPNMRPFARSN